MTIRLTLLCHAATAAMRAGAFPRDEALEDKGRLAASALAPRLPAFDRVLAGPSRRTRETVAALGLGAVEEPALRDCDYGRWGGRTLAEIAGAEPEAAALWLTDPACAPHGGESFMALIRRVGDWLDGGTLAGRVLAVTHAAVMRAAVLHVLGAPAERFWRIDAMPLSMLDLGHDGRRWALRIGVP